MNLVCLCLIPMDERSMTLLANNSCTSVNKFWLIGVDAPTSQKSHFKMSKNSKQKFHCTSGHSVFAHKVSWKKDIFCAVCKKIISRSPKWVFTRHFFYTSQKISFFLAKHCVRTWKGRVHTWFFFPFFYILKYETKHRVHYRTSLKYETIRDLLLHCFKCWTTI